MKATTMIAKLYKIFTTLMACFAFLLFMITPIATAYAEDVNMAYEDSAIENDLQDVNISLYPKNPLGTTYVIRFMEYCYSTRPFLSETYGLYVYIYNPTEKKVKTNSLNVLNMAVSYNADGTPAAYENVGLTYLDCTDNYRFYKFKVKNSARFLALEQEYAQRHSGERRYDVAGVQLFYAEGNLSVVDTSVKKTYYYEGFAQGCSDSTETESTLKCNSETLDTLSLDVHATTYRPKGTNGKNDYTQDSLHSVYFAVPNKYIEKYGEMAAVHATWLNAVLKPALVTGNQEAYAAIQSYLGVTLPNIAETSTSTPIYHANNLHYMYYGGLVGAGPGDTRTFNYGFGYNVLHGWSGQVMNQSDYGSDINPLYLLFNSGTTTDSADNYIVTSMMLQKQMLASAEKYGGELIQGADGMYSKAIFENVDSNYTEVNIRRDDEYDLTSEVLGSSWWDKLWGITTTTTFDGIKAIYAVQDTDITGNVSADCSNLYISEADYTEFSNFYATNKSDSTVYLFRYQVSDYIAQEATLYHYIENGNIIIGNGWQVKDTNAYFFQETVNLNFDIIDVTFEANDVETIIPVVMSPIDVIPSSNSPVHTNSDKDWKGILAILAILVLCLLLIPILSPIIRLLIDILSLPFKFIGWLFRGDKK